MKEVYYKIAGHCIGIRFADDRSNESLLPSFAPFVSERDSELLFEMTVDDAFRFEVRGEEVGQFDCGGSNFGVYRLPDGGYQYEISDLNGTICACLEADAGFENNRVALMPGTDLRRGDGLNNALMLAYAFSSVEKGTLLMHASVVRNAGRGFLCLGKSGTGKSTHTQLWLRHIPGSELMNDDNPVVRYVNGETRVYGSPWSGKTPCYLDVEAPVGGFIRLEQKPENTICREPVARAFASLWPSASNMKWDKRVCDGICNTLSHILAVTPVYMLGCRPDREAAELCSKTVLGAWADVK